MKKYHKDNSTSYALGTTLTIELLKNKIDFVRKIYFKSNFIHNSSYDLILSLINNKNIEVVENDKVFKLLSSKENIFVIAEFFKYETNLELNNHLVLINPENEGNLGTIIRSALGFGVINIAIIKPAVDIFHPNVIRASMGALFKVNIQYFTSFDEYLNNYNNHLYPFMLNGTNNLISQKFIRPYSLIFGPESSGLDKTYNSIGSSVKIVHENTIDSLNLPIAVSIALYETTKESNLK